MENQTVTTVEEIIEESISLSSAKEAYELPTESKKPPLGLMPRKHYARFVVVNRHNELCRAIERYNIAEKELPLEWVLELDYLERYIKNDEIEESYFISEIPELPTNYKASWELEKGIREALERENKELKKLKKRIEYSEKEMQAAWEQKHKAENDFLTTKTELNNERGVSIQLRKDFNEAVSRVDKLDGENKKLTDNLSKLQIQHNNLKESNLSLRKSVINYSSRSTTYLYLSIFLGFVSVAAAIVIVLLLNR